MDPKLPEIFTCNDGYSTSKGALAYLDDKDYDIGHRLFEEHVIRTYGCINAQDVWTTYDHNFSSWFKGHMTYRSRGGLNGRGGIIRPRPKVAEARVSTEPETTSHGVQNQNRQQQQQQQQQQQHVLATVTEQPIEGSEDNQNHQSETHIANDDTIGHEDVNVSQGITVSDDTGNPEAKFRLHPDGLWFGHRKVVDAVVETSYKTYFKGPYYNWGVTPAEVKDRWWNAFKHEFSWDPLIASLVKKEWQSKYPSYKATWCAPALRAHMKKIRQEDEDFKRRSSQCSKNRLQNESQRVHHRQGSISAEEVKINMEKELARLPTAPELYYDGHVDNDGQFVNPKAKQVWDEFQKKKAANLECEDETQKKSEDELFFEVVGGWNEKGRIFGLGAAAHSYYDRPTCDEKNGKKSRREYIKSLETQKELDQTKQELDQTKQELGETKQGLVDTQTNLVRTQQVLIETKKNTGRNHRIFHDFQRTSRKVYAS
ncbi:Adventurous-gliding motility protein Z [Bienertia sinuspersici]